MRLTVEDSILVNIDFQDRLMPHMVGSDDLADRVASLISGLRALDVPSITTQQYTRGLGYTDKRISAALGYENPEELPFIEKTAFSAMDCPEFKEKLDASGRRNVILTGIEGHVCVLQTTVDLIAAGYNPVLIADCVSSRKESDYRIGMKRWEAEGAMISCFESILFELCRYSGTSVFKQISALVK
ncbi:MAG: isochorismatase family protein [Spirochaetales bacterium]|uniref:Isochorismatase family protein n=1 Tax=Candidatus Thalassospirochaeta sargassi TaxID=3119039 RepID=A0AAJ1MLI3_9SPIO|nr:isochorismatase family protein [Spirochaetales bacterium]